ncbi:hypothetical protein H9L39_03633 [Fusarium oxysporum f. sp. albedinis]|nr:hypothetical protein H9L39_03633 [Fusarium oxysporum f. sp. albedinis]
MTSVSVVLPLDQLIYSCNVTLNNMRNVSAIFSTQIDCLMERKNGRPTRKPKTLVTSWQPLTLVQGRSKALGVTV